ncbi:SPOR domain-containing protein [bacterium]|nr:SPOR domain-containing protein [bacterium]
MAPRNFDWGPPSEAFFDWLKDWAPYGLIIFFLGMGFIILLDFSSFEKKDRYFPSILSSAPMPETPGIEAEASFQLISSATEAFRPIFHVQTGAFGDEDMARKTFENISGQGFIASLMIPDEQFEMYRIVLGPYKTEAEADSITRSLNEKGFPSFVVESP